MKKTLLAFSLSVLCVSAANAQEQQEQDKDFRFMVGIGLTAGGQNVATAQYTNGDTNKISAGTGIQLMTGIDFKLAEQVSMQVSVGYHARFALGSNGSATFTRIPIEVLGYYDISNKWRVGAGVQYIPNPSLSGSGAVADLSQDYKSTTGLILEAEYFPMRNLGIKFRAVKESFTPKAPYNYGNSSDPTQSIDGSHVGVFSNLYF